MAGLIYKWLLLPVWLMFMVVFAILLADKPNHPSFSLSRVSQDRYPIHNALSRITQERPTTHHLLPTTYYRLPTTPYSLPAIPRGQVFPIPHSLHPYFVSVSELEWNGRDKQLELSCKLYTDDFEEGLRQVGGEKADLAKGDMQKNKQRIEAYIRSHFQVRINGKALTLQLIGFENDHEATWCYLQSPAREAPSSIGIINTLLYEVKKEQVNIVHLASGEARKSFRLVNPDQSILWTIGQK